MQTYRALYPAGALQFFRMIFDMNGLTEWHKRVFLLSHKYGLPPSEIDAMPYLELKMYLIMFAAWKDETK
nr:MAG TPA: hypothetical protein [Caudoviricetes sp.]